MLRRSSLFVADLNLEGFIRTQEFECTSRVTPCITQSDLALENGSRAVPVSGFREQFVLLQSFSIASIPVEHFVPRGDRTLGLPQNSLTESREFHPHLQPVCCLVFEGDQLLENARLSLCSSAFRYTFRRLSNASRSPGTKDKTCSQCR